MDRQTAVILDKSTPTQSRGELQGGQVRFDDTPRFDPSAWYQEPHAEPSPARPCSDATAFLLATPPFFLATPQLFAQQPPTPAEAAAALNPAAQAFSPQQLDQMLAPIALYPDQLLTAMLMAATFPDQVVDAGKWLQDPGNAAIKGDALAAALQPLPWDPSVKSLIPFPQVVVLMNDHFDWTQSLGIAFASQQVETMARVQFLRDRAVAAGQLKSTPQLVIRRQQNIIVIEPANPGTIYVPVYNPAVVYGTWRDRDYPPVYLPPPRGFTERDVGPGPVSVFRDGVAVGATLWGWSHPDWRDHRVVVDPGRFNRITTTSNITSNHIVIQNDTWHRDSPVAIVPEAARPHREAPAVAAPTGTVASTAVARPGPAPGPGRPPGAEGRPGEPHPAAVSPPPGVGPEQRRPGEAERPPGEEGRPGETTSGRSLSAAGRRPRAASAGRSRAPAGGRGASRRAASGRGVAAAGRRPRAASAGRSRASAGDRGAPWRVASGRSIAAAGRRSRAAPPGRTRAPAGGSAP